MINIILISINLISICLSLYLSNKIIKKYEKALKESREEMYRIAISLYSSNQF